MNIAIIAGSHRQNSESGKLAIYIEHTIKQQLAGVNPWVLDLADNPLPLWEEKIWEGDPEWNERLQPISRQLMASDGFVIISPEWHGMAPAGLKNFFLMWGKGELAHKPALIVTVSTADGGSYPVAELRMSSYKNSRICYLPEHLIIRYVDTVFNADISQNNPDAQAYFEGRLAYCLNQLHEYAKAFRQIRASGAGDLSTYKSGM